VLIFPLLLLGLLIGGQVWGLYGDWGSTPAGVGLAEGLARPNGR